MAEINWGLLQQPTSPVAAYVGGLQTGKQLGQQQHVLDALKTYDPTNPTPTVNSLLQVGAIPEASGIAQVGFQNQQRQILSQGMNALLQSQQPPQPAAPQAPPAQPAPTQAAPTDPSQLNPDQQAHALQTADLFDQVGIQLSQMPYEQRKAALAAATPSLVARGISADQIAGFDPTDQNLAAAHEQIAQLRGQIGGNGQPMQTTTDTSPAPVADPSGAGAVPVVAPAAAAPQVAATGPGAPQVAASPAPAGGPAINLRDPATVHAIEMMSMGGANVDPLIALGNANLPKYSATRSGIVFDENTGKFVRGGPNEQGIAYDVDGSGNVSAAHNVPGYVDASAVQAATKAAAEAAGKLPYAGPTAQAESGGHAAGEAPYEVQEIHNSDGTTSKGVLSVVNGKTVWTPLQPSAAASAAGAGSGGNFNTSITPNAKSFQEKDADAFSHTVSTVGDPSTMIGYQNKAATATQAVNNAMALDPNAGTPFQAKLANILNIAHLDGKQANNLSYYASLIPQVTRGSFATFPRLEKEFELVKDAIPSMATPRDAAALTFATIAAVNNRNAAYSKFVAGYKGDTSQRALNQAWLASPQSQTSLFADPVFKNLTMGGKPAVYVNPTPAPNGHTYGVFRPGTPQAQTFLVN